MKTRTKLLVDLWIGKSLVIILNLLARILGFILRIDHSLEKPPSRIVVCKFLGMGSIIQATPLLQTLRNNFPKAEIVFVTANANRKLLESVGVIDKIYDVDDTDFGSLLRSTLAVLRTLWNDKPDLYIDLETYSFFSTALATMSCSRNRFGFYRQDRNIRMGVYTHMMFFNARAPISESYLQMARLAGCKTVTESLYPFIITESDKMSCRRKMVELIGNFSGSPVIINPNASDLRIERRWPWKNFIDLIQLLRSAYPEKIFILIGSANENNWTSGILSRLDSVTKQGVYNSAGLFTLYELFALIQSSELVISNDTGPMHISFALGRPTISLFGPASPKQYGQNPNAYGIYKNIYCSPCVHDFMTPPCKGDNQCMKQITVEEVFELCRKILSGNLDTENTKHENMKFMKGDNIHALGVVERSTKF